MIQWVEDLPPGSFKTEGGHFFDFAILGEKNWTKTPGLFLLGILVIPLGGFLLKNEISYKLRFLIEVILTRRFF